MRVKYVREQAEQIIRSGTIWEQVNETRIFANSLLFGRFTVRISLMMFDIFVILSAHSVF